MAANTKGGRPKKACTICRSHKIRCSSDQPTCSRCSRLQLDCNYGNTPCDRNTRAALSASSQPRPPLKHSASNHGRLAHQLFEGSPSTAAPRSVDAEPGHSFTYTGISTSLALELASTCFSHVYQAGILLHEASFHQSIRDGTASPHVLLAVCAFGANFYHDEHGRATFREHGFTIEWAKRAGKLVFQQAEDLREENITAHVILSLFWHSQGHWQVSQLHLGSAAQLLSIQGLGPSTENTFDDEVRRRRCWTWFLLASHAPYKLTCLDPLTSFSTLPLPWPEDDFDAKLSNSPLILLASSQSNGGVAAELMRAAHIWSYVARHIHFWRQSSLAKTLDVEKIANIIHSWWQSVPAPFKLTRFNMSQIPLKHLPRLILINVFYHQSLCILHSSVVPLFSFIVSSGQAFSKCSESAQVAFDHTCAISDLSAAILEVNFPVARLPSILAYTAYSGSAILIPFMWCSRASVRARVFNNASTNIRIIQELAKHWRFAALMELHVRCLYQYHRSHPLVLANEPSYLEESAFGALEGRNEKVQISILEFTGILKSKSEGWLRQGEEPPSLDIEANQSADPEMPDGAKEPPTSGEISASQHWPSVSSHSAINDPFSVPATDAFIPGVFTSGTTSQASEHSSGQSSSLLDPLLLDPVVSDFTNLQHTPGFLDSSTTNFDDFTFDFLDMNSTS